MKPNHDMDQIRRYILDFRVREGIQLSLFEKESPKHTRSALVKNQVVDMFDDGSEPFIDEETQAPIIQELSPGKFMELRVRADDDGALTWFNLGMNGSWYALALNALLESNQSRWLTHRRDELADLKQDAGVFREDEIIEDAVCNSERMVAFLTPKNFDWGFEELGPDDIEGNFVKVKSAIDRLVATFDKDWTWGWLEVAVKK